MSKIRIPANCAVPTTSISRAGCTKAARCSSPRRKSDHRLAAVAGFGDTLAPRRHPTGLATVVCAAQLRDGAAPGRPGGRRLAGSLGPRGGGTQAASGEAFTVFLIGFPLL